MKKIWLYFDEIIAGTGLCVMSVLVAANVLLRMLANVSIKWADELSCICFAYTIYLGASSLYKRYGHSSIDIVVKMLPEKAQGVCASLSTVILTITCSVSFALSCIYCVSSMTRKTALLKLPYSVEAFAMVLGFGSMTVSSLLFMRNLILKKDYFHEMPIYKDLMKLDTAEDLALLEHELKMKGREGDSNA